MDSTIPRYSSTKVTTICYEDEIPAVVGRSIFLAGPTPRSDDVISWRHEALRFLEEAGYDGVLYIPEFRYGYPVKDLNGYEGMVEWEKKCLNQADVILFWVPRDLQNLPGFTTNIEAGFWFKSGKCVYGRPHGTPHTKYLDWMYEDLTKQIPKDSLYAVARESMAKEPVTMNRTGGERFVPLQIWKTEAFQSWYKAHTLAGNRLDDARLLWSFVPRGSGKVFSFVLWVKVWIDAEQRYKENEWIFSRRDISTVVLYSKDKIDPEIVLVKEFRSPVRNEDCFVLECPGGSATTKEDPINLAVHEVEEETSLQVDSWRMKYYGTKQVSATLSTHHSLLFGCELTDEEMAKAKEIAKSGNHFGIESDSERTYLYVCKASDLSDISVDWATIGMIYTVMENRKIEQNGN